MNIRSEKNGSIVQNNQICIIGIRSKSTKSHKECNYYNLNQLLHPSKQNMKAEAEH